MELLSRFLLQIYLIYSLLNLYSIFLINCDNISNIGTFYCYNIYQTTLSTLSTCIMLTVIMKIQKEFDEIEQPLLSLNFDKNWRILYLIILFIKVILCSSFVAIFIRCNNQCNIVDVLAQSLFPQALAASLVNLEQFCHSINLFIDFFFSFMGCFYFSQFVVRRTRKKVMNYQKQQKRIKHRMLEFTKINIMNKPSDITTEHLRLDGDNCVICQREYTNSKDIVFMPCQHQQHANCLNDWFEKQKSCPLCRKAYDQLDNI